MSLFKRVTGIENHEGSLNALLALRLLRLSDPQTISSICDQIAEIMLRVSPGFRNPREHLILELSSKPLVTQMNFVALACIELGLYANVEGMGWYIVQNPYRLGENISLEHLKAATSTLKRYGADGFWPDAAEHAEWGLSALLQQSAPARAADEWPSVPSPSMEDPSLPLRCPKCNQRLNAPRGKRLKLRCPSCTHEWVQMT